MEKRHGYYMDGQLKEIQIFRKKTENAWYNNEKLFYKIGLEKVWWNFFLCSLCKQVEVEPPIVSHVLSEDHFAKVIRLVGKTFYMYKLCDNFLCE